jgi:hypothetical protein
LFCRALYNSLPFPVWNGDLAPEYTLMMPVTNVSVSAYQATIPAINPGAAAAGGGGPAGAVAPAAPAAGPNAAAQGGAGATINPLQAAPSGSPGNVMQQGAGRLSPAPGAVSPQREAGLIGTRDEGGIELGGMPAPSGGIFSNMMGALRGSGGVGTAGAGGSGAGRNVSYTRLENQSSSHGADESNNV